MSQNDPVPLMAYRRIGIQVGCSPALLLRAAGVPFVEEAQRGDRLVRFPKSFVERQRGFGGGFGLRIKIARMTEPEDAEHDMRVGQAYVGLGVTGIE